MEKSHWTSSDIQKLFRLDERIKSRQTLFNAEERGEIPTAARIARGKQQIRHWTLEQLPEIGSRFGFLKKPKEPQIICIYTAKGGVLKTTLAYSLARILAINGSKRLSEWFIWLLVCFRSRYPMLDYRYSSSSERS